MIIALLLIRPAQAVQDGAGNEIIPVGTAAGNVMDVASGKFNLQGDTGNVGIGSTVPQAKLDVEGSAYFGNGNIGVGSSVPSQKIDVLGTVKASAFSGDGSGITGITGAISGLNVGYISKSLTATSINDSVIYQAAGNNIGIGTTAPNGKLIVYGGNVGVGTTAPRSAVDVIGTVTATAFVGDGSGLTGIATAGGWTRTGTYVYVSTSSDSVGIGTSVPLSKLDIVGAGATSATASLVIRDSTKTAKVAVLDNGNVGIGTTEPAQMLHVVGQGMRTAAFTGGSVGFGTTSPSIAAVLDAWGNVYVSSDATHYAAYKYNGISAGAGGTYSIVGSGATDVAISGSSGVSLQSVLFAYLTNVGIGTSSPVSLLDVNSRFNVLSGGNVGIASTAPQAKLDVEGSIYVGNGNIGVGSSAPLAKLELVGAGTTSATASLVIRDSTNTAKVTVLDNGSVGIGTTAPGAKLTVVDGAGVAQIGNFSGYGAIGYSLASTYALAFSGTNTLINSPSGGGGGLYFRIGNTDKMVLDANGNVGINSTVPQAKLDVEGSIYVGNGNVGLGSSSPLTKLDVSGNAYFNGNVGIGTSVLTSTLQVAAGGTLAIPQGTAPTVSLAGQLAIDTTADQLVYYGGAERVMSYEMTRCGYFADLTANDDQISLGTWSQPVTITGVGCTYNGTGTTKATFTLEDGAANAMTITGTNPTCTANSSAFTFAAVTAGNSLSAGMVVRFNVTNTPAPTTDDYTICVKYVYTRQ